MLLNQVHREGHSAAGTENIVQRAVVFQPLLNAQRIFSRLCVFFQIETKGRSAKVEADIQGVLRGAAHQDGRVQVR